MKYYHIVYNSSQRTQDGSAGLGVRTYTKGTPKEYINLLKDEEFFNYNSGDLSQPSPKALMEDGKIILNYPATYRFAKLFSAETGKVIYVLSRTVSVGFDYPYYVKFVAARVDNFVTDAFVFEDFPTDKTFEILYENPAPGNQCFIPRDRVPSPENLEMQTLSLGEMGLLEDEEKSFACQELGQVSELAFELLFAYIESCRLRLPLLVKCSATDAPSLMADLIRLLPAEMQKETFFYTNYQLEGVKEGYKVFFVNEHYKYDYESTGQFYVFDMTQNTKVATDESGTFREEWKRLFNDDNKDEYLKRLKWVLSPAYEWVRGKKDSTKQVFYNYLVDPKSFNFNQVFLGDDELLTSLSDYFAKDRNNQQLFDKHLGVNLVHDQVKGNNWLSLLQFVDKLESKGFNLKEVVSNAKKGVSCKLLESPEVLKNAIDSLGIKSLDKYIVKEMFEGRKDYLEADELKKEWPKIYKYFYPVSEQNDYVKILSKMLSLNLSESVVDEVIKGFNISEIQLCDCLAEVAKRDTSEIDIPYKRIKDILDNQERKHLELPKPDLAEKIDKYILAPLMKDQERPNGIESCHELMQLLCGKFNEQNAAALIARALKIDTSQSASLLFYKGLPYIKEKDVDAFVNQLVNNVKHERIEFYDKVNRHPLKVQLLAAYFKKNGDNKKTAEKLRKDGILNLSDAEFADLLHKIASSNAEGSNDSDNASNTMMGWLKYLIAVVVVALLIVGCFIFLRHPKTQEQTLLKFEVYSPVADEDINVKGFINSLTSDSEVPKGSNVGDIYADSVKGKEAVVYFKVVAEQKAEPSEQMEKQDTVLQQMEEPINEEQELSEEQQSEEKG